MQTSTKFFLGRLALAMVGLFIVFKYGDFSLLGILIIALAVIVGGFIEAGYIEKERKK
jgi:hypothetical protein